MPKKYNYKNTIVSKVYALEEIKKLSVSLAGVRYTVCRSGILDNFLKAKIKDLTLSFLEKAGKQNIESQKLQLSFDED